MFLFFVGRHTYFFVLSTKFCPLVTSSSHKCNAHKSQMQPLQRPHKEDEQEMLTEFLFDTNHNKEEMERRKEWMYQLWRARQMKMVEKTRTTGAVHTPSRVLSQYPRPHLVNPKPRGTDGVPMQRQYPEDIIITTVALTNDWVTGGCWSFVDNVRNCWSFPEVLKHCLELNLTYGACCYNISILNQASIHPFPFHSSSI